MYDTLLSPAERCPDLWFSDCGLIVRVGNVLFRISREMLAARSPVFADMLAFTQPDDAETVDGCPIVVLHDAPEEVAVFFKALFNHDFFHPYPALTDYETIAGVLRLSHKYQVDSLRKRALVHLGSAFEEREGGPVKASWTIQGHQLPPLISLCREVSAIWILPHAFYCYSKIFDHRDILFGHPILSPEDRLRALSGAVALRTHKTSEFLDFLWNPEQFEGCHDPEYCLSRRYSARRWAERQRVHRLPHDFDINVRKIGVCGICRPALKKAHRLARGEFHHSVPEIFGLPSWAELETMKLAELQ